MSDEENKIDIRCPQCAQRFRVGKEFIGKMVECGACDKRFRITDEVQINRERFYPGEHKDREVLQRFRRIPSASPITGVGATPYEAPTQQISVFSPIRFALGVAALLWVTTIGLTLYYGVEPGRILDGVSLDRRIILAVFSGIVGIILLVLANRNARGRAITAGIFGLLALMAISILRSPEPWSQELETMDIVPMEEGLTQDDTEEGDEFPESLAEIRKKMRSKPLEDAFRNYTVDGNEKLIVAGVWLRDVREYNRDLIERYLIRKTNAEKRSWSYPRPPHDVLIVLFGVKDDLRALSQICERFGEPLRIIEPLNTVEVRVDNERFKTGNESELLDPSNEKFYALNLRELESIDIQRAVKAAKRISTVEPKMYRNDIVRKLQELAEDDDLENREAAVRALTVWAEPGDGSVELVRNLVKEMVRTKLEVSRTIIRFLATQKDSESMPSIHTLWTMDPGEWEGPYSEFGSAIEPAIINDYGKLSFLGQLSAVRLLGRIGTSKGLAFLRSIEGQATGELSTQVAASIRSLQEK